MHEARSAVDTIGQGMMIPELLRTFPEARGVLDRYGLRGCGGPLGPVESIGFFARAHGVPLEQLLGELRQVVQQPNGVNAAKPVVLPPSEAIADSIYRPFFTGGILVMLTLGVSWGAVLLLRITAAGRFDGLSIHEVNAHGHAQIFGWVGLFVMGFAYQVFPRFKHTSLSHPRWAYASFWMMLAGLIVRAVAQALATSWPGLGAVGVAASIVEVAAIGILLYVVVSTLRHAPRGLEVFDYYILAALGWFFIQAALGTVYFAATLAAADRQSLLALIATWQPPLREIQVHGFATLMILGVSQRLFHHFYGFPPPSAARSRAVLPLFNLALLGITLGLVLMRVCGHAWAGLWYASALLLAASIVYLVLGWKLFSRPAETDRSLKFLRTAYVWLFISLGMLVLLPVYQMVLIPRFAAESHAAQIGFSHAYYGAIRHAVTVGFVSFMIVGVAAKLVPTLNGVSVHRLGGLWAPYMLLLSGCTLRVAGQSATDFTASAFPVTGVSGLLELAGLTIWGVHLLRLMAVRPAATGESSMASRQDQTCPNCH